MNDPVPDNEDSARPDTLGVLLVNLGTPDSPAPRDVRRYLKEFLWDPRVVELARPLWWLVLNLIILNTLPRRSAAAYARVWTAAGSPLLVVSKQLQQALQYELDCDLGAPVAGLRSDGADAFDAADRVLDHLGDPGLDHRAGRKAGRAGL